MVSEEISAFSALHTPNRWMVRCDFDADNKIFHSFLCIQLASSSSFHLPHYLYTTSVCFFQRPLLATQSIEPTSFFINRQGYWICLLCREDHLSEGWGYQVEPRPHFSSRLMSRYRCSDRFNTAPSLEVSSLARRPPAFFSVRSVPLVDWHWPGRLLAWSRLNITNAHAAKKLPVERFGIFLIRLLWNIFWWRI